MLATIVNAAAVVLGSLFGLLLRRRVGDRIRRAVYAGIGVVAVVVGLSMSLEFTKPLFFAIALVLGGVIGTAIAIDDAILGLGKRIHGWLKLPEEGEGAGGFAAGFLDATVLFCVGALAIVGSFEAGTAGDYSLIFTKSVMDGFMALLLTSALGLGVMFSAIPILLYQGGLTLLATLLQPYVTPLVLSEISGVGGAMVIMIGLNLLGLTKIKTADFLPALLVVVVFVALAPVLAPLGL